MLFRKLHLNWRYGISELAIVVVGVMIALAADGWVQTRADRALERQYLQGLATDLRADTAELSNAISLAAQRAALGHEVLAAMDGETVLSPAELATAVERQMYFTYPAYYRTTVLDLMSTGNFRLIRDQRLKRGISEYYQAIDRQQQWSGNWRRIQMDMEYVLPELLDLRHREGLLSKDAPWEGWDGPRQSFPWAPTFVVTTADAESILQRLRNHPEARARIEGMVRIQGSQYAQLSRVKTMASNTLELVEGELQRR